jgi:hypothetical protein
MAPARMLLGMMMGMSCILLNEGFAQLGDGDDVGAQGFLVFVGFLDLF